MPGPVHKTHKTNSREQLALVTPTMQKVFLGILAFNWLGTLGVPLYAIVNGGTKVNAEFFAYVIMQSLLPVFFVLIATPFVWRHYRGTLKRWFMAGATGLLGVVTYGAVIQLENAFRYKFYPPNQTQSDGFWQQYSHDITLLCLALAVYVAILGLWDTRLTRRGK